MTATALSATALDVEWIPPGEAPDIETYRLYRDGELVASVEGVRHEDEGLSPFTEYEYAVSAVNRVGLEGESSEPVRARTMDGTPPTAPTGLTGRPVGTTHLDLTWSHATDPETGVADYRIYRGGVQVGTTSGASTFSDTGLDPSTAYSYEVSAVNGDGLEGERSGPATATTLDPQDESPPSAPTDLVATAAGPSQVDLIWSPSSDPQSGVSAYRVYRDHGQVATLAGETEYTDTGLDPSADYVYEVSAVNGDGVEGPKSTSAKVTTPRADDTSPPPAPSGLRATAVTGTKVELNWSTVNDPESGVAGYRVYRNGAFVSNLAASSSPSFTDAGLARFTEYVYEVTAVNGDGLEGARSSPAQVRTPDDTPPTRPSDVVATTVGRTGISLEWSPAKDGESGVSVYRIYRDGARVGTVSGTTSFSDSGLEPAREYSYEVSAVNGDGLEGPRSDPAVATTTDATPPTRPANLEAAAASPTRVELSWTASSDPESGVSSYRIFRDGERIGTTSGATEFSDAGLSPATTYEYEVSAVNGDDLEGARSAPAVVTTPDATPPTRPTDLTAEAAGPTRVDLDWTAAEDPESGISAYRVYRDGAPVGQTQGATSYSDTDVEPFTSYSYRVSAVNGDGDEGESSESVSVSTPDGTPPTVPSDVSAEAVGSTLVVVGWSASADPETGVAAYRIYRDGNLVGEVSHLVTAFSNPGLTPSTTYRYEVSAVNGADLESPRSAPVAATTPSQFGLTAAASDRPSWRSSSP